jgi:hypothetical protein
MGTTRDVLFNSFRAYRERVLKRQMRDPEGKPTRETGGGFPMTEPRDNAEWTEQFEAAVEEFNGILSLEPITLAEGEVLQVFEINRALTEVAASFRSLGGVADKVRRLEAIVTRWRDQAFNLALLEAGGKRETYPDAAMRKAYAETKVDEMERLIMAAKLTREAIHDERSRLWAYREDLFNIGHNVRRELEQ